MTRLAQAVADARAAFAAAGLPDAAIEARLLLGGLLGLSSTDVFVGGDRILSEDEMTLIGNAVARRLKREPVHRILGRREFHGMELQLSTGTLEPRPDTEVLVDCMVELAEQIVAARGTARILDLGTGTGAIILALLNAVPGTSGVAVDISQDALSTAARNAASLGLADRLQTVQSHWFDAIEGRFDIIVSNPPYIASHVIPALEPEVRDFDPLAALDGGHDGLLAYRAIADGADAFLKEGGFVGLEIGYDQKVSVSEIFQSAGFALTQAKRDYGDNDRALVFARNKPDVA